MTCLLVDSLKRQFCFRNYALFRRLLLFSYGNAIPYFAKLQSDGESGRKKINQITRWLTIVTLVQDQLIHIIYRTL
jgi:hypothetical protein